MGQTKKIKRKASHWSIIKFALIRVHTSIIIWVLLGLSIALFIGIGLMLFLSSANVESFMVNFQYGVLIFNNIFLLLLILLIVAKIFSQEFSNGTYLLILSKPYSRFTIFILKYISIWLMIFIFLGINMLTAFLVGFLSQAITKNEVYFQLYNSLILKLLVYSLMLSYFASSGIIFISTFLSSQAVLLIVVIFCSLFLIGGMPYSLIMNIGNNISLNFENVTQEYTVENIKNALLFNQKVEHEDIQYPKMSKAIYDFYMQKYLPTINLILANNDNNSSKVNRLDNLYNKVFNLTKVQKLENLTGTDVSSWKGTYNGKSISSIITENVANGKETNITVTITNNYAFKTIDELDKNNPYQYEIKQLVDYYAQNFDWNTYYNLRLFYFNSLLTFDSDHTYFDVYADGDSVPTVNDKNIDPVDIFQNLYEQDNGSAAIYYNIGDSTFKQELENFFENPVLFVMQEFEKDIIQKVYDYKIIQTQPLKETTGLKKYLALSQNYSLISKLNVIEHWNQIWTSSLSYLPVGFAPLENSHIDFDSQKNLLMSYQDFPLAINSNNKINLNYQFYLNINLIRNVYLILAAVLIIISTIILQRKNIV
ncbi:putative ABC-type transport system permease protein [Spiroplasma eriocheiris CCTCC M 207170]|nr:putative ABC-type transport system permease protein [Spiroplasma eriocheiris CCTCC M 207170]